MVAIERFTNFAEGTLVSGITAGGTAIIVGAVAGMLFPTLTGGDQFRITMWDGSTSPELIIVTAHSGDGNFTVTRGTESTTAAPWQAGSRCRLVPTAQQLSNIINGPIQNTIDVRDDAFGAVGGDVTLDTAGFIAALASASAGDVVVFGNAGSDYLLNAKLTIPAGVSFMGIGHPTLDFSALTGVTNAIETTWNATGRTFIRDFTIDSGDAGGYQIVQKGSNWSIQQVVFKDAGLANLQLLTSASAAEPIEDFSLEDCDFDKAQEDCVVFDLKPRATGSYISHGVFRNCKFKEAGASGPAGTGTEVKFMVPTVTAAINKISDIVFENCKIDLNSAAANRAQDFGVFVEAVSGDTINFALVEHINWYDPKFENSNDASGTAFGVDSVIIADATTQVTDWMVLHADFGIASFQNFKTDWNELLHITQQGTIHVPTYAALKAYDATIVREGQVFLVEGRDTVGDGGEGFFKATFSSPGADNDGTLLDSDTSGLFFVRLFSSAVNVLWFGTDTTGIVASSSKVQATVDALPTTGGVVDLTGGKIKFDAQVIVPPRVHLIGRGANATRINSADSLSPFKFINAGGASGDYEGGGLRDVSISLDDALIGIECVDIWGLEFKHVRFFDGDLATERLIKASGECFEMRVQDCRMEGFTVVAVDLQNDCNSCVITGNDFVAATGATTAKSVVVKDANHAYIHGNRFEYATVDAGIKIELENSDNTVIHGNSIQVSTALQGILLKGSSKFTSITSNKISTSGTASGIIVEGTVKNFAISNNHFELSSAIDGIFVNGQPRGAIIGNTFEIDAAISGAAISIATGSNSITVIGNVIEGDNESTPLGGTGIHLQAGALRCIINDNIVRNMTIGIDSDVANSSVTSLIRNNITENNTTNQTVSNPLSVSLTDGWKKHPTEHLAVSSGSTLAWSNIPADATKIRILYAGFSADATIELGVRLGDSGGFETSGYVGRVVDSGSGIAWSVAGSISKGAIAGSFINGSVSITKMATAGTKWFIEGHSVFQVSGSALDATGSKSLSGTLNQVQLLLIGATTEEFDAGDFVLEYQ